MILTRSTLFARISKSASSFTLADIDSMLQRWAIVKKEKLTSVIPKSSAPVLRFKSLASKKKKSDEVAEVELFSRWILLRVERSWNPSCAQDKSLLVDATPRLRKVRRSLRISKG